MAWQVHEPSPRSVDGAWRDDPLARLAGDSRDAVEVRVVVQDGETARFGRGGNQQVGHLPAALVPRGEQALHLPRPTQMVSTDSKTSSARSRRSHGRAARGVADLQGADVDTPCPAGVDQRLHDRADSRVPEPGDAGVDEMGQRHAFPRGSSDALASTSSALRTAGRRSPAAWRNARSTVSLIVWVPSSALAALKTSSSISTSRFVTPGSIS